MTQQDVLDYIRKTPHNSNVNVVKGMLDSLGGSSLPEVTNEDNGKVLTVVEGEWDKAAGGGAEPLIVGAERFPCPNDDSKSYAVLDTTWQAIKEACDADRLVLLKEEFDDEFGYAQVINYLCEVSGEDGYYSVKFLADNGLAIFTIDSEDGYPSNSGGCQGGN